MIAVVLLVGVPLVDRISGARSSSMAIWLGILIVGVIAITIASALERGRAAIRRSVGRIADLTNDWESDVRSVGAVEDPSPTSRPGCNYNAESSTTC